MQKILQYISGYQTVTYTALFRSMKLEDSWSRRKGALRWECGINHVWPIRYNASPISSICFDNSVYNRIFCPSILQTLTSVATEVTVAISCATIEFPDTFVRVPLATNWKLTAPHALVSCWLHDVLSSENLLWFSSSMRSSPFRWLHKMRLNCLLHFRFLRP